MTWQAAAAWVGAILGFINLAGGIWASRPRVTLWPDARGIGDSGASSVVNVAVTAGDRPVLLQSLRLFPSQRAMDAAWCEEDSDGSVFRAIVEWHIHGSFLHHVPADTTRIFRVKALNEYRYRLVYVHWWDQRFRIFPWTVRILSRKRIIELNNASVGVPRPAEEGPSASKVGRKN
ncbi:hypothetical protein ACQW02_16120 [Humitalea sp. 24SJ18S-53]|uniref:hypothetical protein n=1 Tax=Humitalea sp. 24SJ18S-53 TaxID=3422307 RepID=UPI003D672341